MIGCIRAIVMAMACAVAGCVPYARVEMALVDQARKGVALSRRHAEGTVALVEKVHELRVRALDDAFDDDVRARAELTPEWVIEHRRAYEAALVAVGDERERLLRAGEVDRRNLTAVDAALERLRWMQAVEVNWLDGPEEKP